MQSVIEEYGRSILSVMGAWSVAAMMVTVGRGSVAQMILDFAGHFF